MTAPSLDEGAVTRRSRPPLAIVLFGFLPLAAMLLLALLGPLLLTVDPNRQALSAASAPPSAAYRLGADNLGRSIAARVIAGARVSLGIAVAGVIASLVTGLALGFLAAFHAGWIRQVVMRLSDVIIACPGLLFVILISGLLGGGIGPILFGLWMSQWPGFARLTAATTARELATDHVEAARLLGFGRGYIFRAHVLPAITPYLTSLGALTVGANVLTISSVGFLGLGLRPPDAEWGAMIAGTMTFFRTSPHMVLAPAAAILICTLSATLIGEYYSARR
ncbi:ABC transporter permease [Chelatococcus asaccharovorans]|uniref:Peptide/nickel transport system permease protein n=1 Tax=Chelatococcus asaccharovorans TaxID=28210 RepID=A0A2V3U7B7_9HYPH|nr:ABC transporter permease [Chelatococcus asaccharovorans]MBS7705668.1 ABC transporter permease [Chelatococcus asaccharovorans]PXW58686.1 peptide/nickel transport system permease protein [Chelatococcus asaccharovorans]